MTSATLARVLSATAAEIATLSEPDEAAAALLKDEMTPSQFLDALVGAEHIAGAVQFLAYALPRREGVYWGLLCARTALGDALGADAKATLDATETWLMEATDENRRALLPLADKVGYGTAAGCTALAGYFSGGSITPAEFEAVEPGPELSPKMLCNALQLSAVARTPDQIPELRRLFLEKGTAIANSPCPWEL